MNLKQYLLDNNIKKKETTGFSLKLTDLPTENLEGVEFTVLKELYQETPERCKHKINVIEVSGSPKCNKIQLTDCQMLKFVDQVPEVNVGDLIVFKDIKKKQNSNSIVFKVSIKSIKPIVGQIAIDKPKVEPTITHKESEMSKALENWIIVCKTKENCTSLNDEKIKNFIKNHLDDPTMPGFGNFKKLHKELKQYALQMVSNAPKRQEFLLRLISYLEKTYSIVEEMPTVEEKELVAVASEVEFKEIGLDELTDEDFFKVGN